MAEQVARIGIGLFIDTSDVTPAATEDLEAFRKASEEIDRQRRELAGPAVDAELVAFDEFFQRDLGNDPLTRGEKAIIKTFLLYHLVFKQEQAEKARAAGAEG